GAGLAGGRRACLGAVTRTLVAVRLFAARARTGGRGTSGDGAGTGCVGASPWGGATTTAAATASDATAGEGPGGLGLRPGSTMLLSMFSKVARRSDRAWAGFEAWLALRARAESSLRERFGAAGPPVSGTYLTPRNRLGSPLRSAATTCAART